MTGQGGFGFPPVFGQGPRVKSVRLGRGAMFWCADAGRGWVPLVASSCDLEAAGAACNKRWPNARVVVVDASEVGK